MITEMRKFKQAIRNSELWQRLVQPLREHESYRRWLLSGTTGPIPHYVKVRNILAIADFCGGESFVETGTLYGDTVAAVEHRFRHIVSIELDERLYRDAKRRFCRKQNIDIVHGDSAELLP